MTKLSTFADKPPLGWYLVTVSDPGVGAQWVNTQHVVRMVSNGKGGTTLIFTDGNATNITDPMPVAEPTPPPPVVTEPVVP